MATSPRTIGLASGLLFVLGIGACQLKANEGTALSTLSTNEDGGGSRNLGTGGAVGPAPFDPYCGVDPTTCEMGTGGTAGAPAEDPYCGLGTSTNCAFPGVQDRRECIRPEKGSAPMPRGIGGDIFSGVYELDSFIEYGDTSHCLVNSWMVRYQVLRIDSGAGWLVNEDNHFLHWPMTFRYSTAGERIDVSVTCSPYGGSFGVNVPYGPFGPFETFTATVDRLQLFSPTCRYHATFRRVGP
ncbi:MAG TPA: hypothetical protein VFH73_07870 [Polyangia bacterium]|nr:hypothetical protein [Polyangia bacterium]